MTAVQRRSKWPAVFMRGGTSKALMFHRRDLPADEAEWQALFVRAMGSPDPHGRQLDGMGGGVTSVSKVCVIAPPTRDDADVDYSFFQVLPKEARVVTHGNCGNMSAAVGPFAVDEGLVAASGRDAVVRIHNTNTRKIIRATFGLDAAGKAAVEGDLIVPGVSGSGAPVRLDFLEPGGAATGRLLPTGAASDVLTIDGAAVEVSIVDAANACVFVSAEGVGLDGTELPQVIEADRATLARLHAIGAHAAVAMGLASDVEAASRRLPLIAVVSAPQDAPTLSGDRIGAAAADVCIRMLSSGQPHRALPATGAVCTAVAMKIEGSVVERLARRRGGGARCIAMPSGLIEVDACVTWRGGLPHAASGTLYRTARRLFEGYVHA